MNRRTRIAFPIWPALVAALLQLLWPVIETQNAAADGFASQALAHDHHHGTAYDGAPEPGHRHQKSHCDFCTSAAVNAILAPDDASRHLTALGTETVKPAVPELPQDIPLFISRVYARAPPILS